MFCGQKTTGAIRLLDTLNHVLEMVLDFTFVFQVLQDGDNGLQWDAVSQKQLPGTVLLEGLPVQGLDCGHTRGKM